MVAAYSNPKILEDHSKIFLCVLYFLGRGILDRSFDSDKVFDGIKTTAFTDRELARAEIVQHLQMHRQIEYDRTNNTVRLRQEGLTWANGACDKPPYLNYKQ
jgi:hypothetical protein